mgnify:FL=1
MHKKTVIDFKELGVRQIFTDAIKELKTKDIKEVKHLLAEVEAYQNKGYYAVGYVSYEAAPAFETKFQVIDGPLMSEYLLYFTIHETVQMPNCSAYCSQDFRCIRLTYPPQSCSLPLLNCKPSDKYFWNRKHQSGIYCRSFLP